MLFICESCGSQCISLGRKVYSQESDECRFLTDSFFFFFFHQKKSVLRKEKEVKKRTAAGSERGEAKTYCFLRQEELVFTTELGVPNYKKNFWWHIRFCIFHWFYFSPFALVTADHVDSREPSLQTQARPKPLTWTGPDSPRAPAVCGRQWHSSPCTVPTPLQSARWNQHTATPFGGGVHKKRYFRLSAWQGRMES